MVCYCGKCGTMIDVPLGRPRLCPDCAPPPEPDVCLDASSTQSRAELAEPEPTEAAS